jgi:glutaminase
MFRLLALVCVAGLLALATGTAAARGPYGARDADYQMALKQAHERYRNDKSGNLSPAIAALGGVTPEHFGIVIVRVDGKVFEIGDSNTSFVICDIAAAFTAALAADQLGGGNSSGAAAAVTGTAPVPDARTAADFGAAPYSPLLEEGALSTLSLVKPQGDAAEKWSVLLGNLAHFAGRELELDSRVYPANALVPRASEMSRELRREGRLQDDPEVTADLFLRQQAVAVTTHDLAVMAATLANGGVNPLTRKAVVGPAAAERINSQLLGPRKGSSAWMAREGIAASAGMGGGIIVVIPGRLGLATYSPPLDKAGVSVRGQRAIRYLSKALFFATP